MADLKTMTELLTHAYNPSRVGASAQQGFTAGVDMAQQAKLAAFKQKLEEANILPSSSLGNVGADLGLNIPSNVNIPTSQAVELAKAASEERAKKAAKLAGAQPLDQAEIEANAKAIELSGAPNALPLAAAYRASAKNLNAEKGSQLGARFSSIATSSGMAAGQPMRTAQGDALKNIDIPNTASAIASQIVSGYKPEYVGPLTGRLAHVKETTGLGQVSEAQSEWRAAVADLKNTDVKQFAGSAVSGSEWARVKMQLPDENTKPAQFVGRYNRAAKTFNSMIDAKEQTLGVDLGIKRWPLLPSTENADQNPSNITIPQTAQAGSNFSDITPSQIAPTTSPSVDLSKLSTDDLLKMLKTSK